MTPRRIATLAVAGAITLGSVAVVLGTVGAQDGDQPPDSINPSLIPPVSTESGGDQPTGSEVPPPVEVPPSALDQPTDNGPIGFDADG